MGSIDPVCGMTVNPATAAGHADYQGKTYHFCSQHCHAFKANPGKFLGKKVVAVPADSGARNTCPMHPEIVQLGQAPAPSAAWRWCRWAARRRTTTSCATSRAGCG